MSHALCVDEVDFKELGDDFSVSLVDHNVINQPELKFLEAYVDEVRLPFPKMTQMLLLISINKRFTIITSWRGRRIRP